MMSSDNYCYVRQSRAYFSNNNNNDNIKTEIKTTKKIKGGRKEKEKTENNKTNLKNKKK